MIGMIWTAMACDEHGQQLAGIRSVPRSYYDMKGRPDEHLWMEACDKEIKKLLEMGTFSIVDEVTFHPATRVSTAACLSRSRRIVTGISWSIVHVATPTVGSKRLPKGKMLHCRRLIYGLKQAAHGWSQMFVKSYSTTALSTQTTMESRLSRTTGACLRFY